MSPTLIERVTNLILPSVLIIASIIFLIFTAITAPKLLLSDFSAYRNLAFARLWATLGEKLSEDTPLSINDILASTKGVVLDIGPGAGFQLSRFSRPKQIQMIYGAEPGTDMHKALNENAVKAGLGSKYRILTCGAESESLVPALAKEGVLGKGSRGVDGVFDEIVSIRVLCGVPNLQETVDGLYRLLKPGGRLVVCEHVVNEPNHGGSWISRIAQQFYTLLGWSMLLGNCHLTRDTKTALMNSAKVDGGWKSVRLDGYNTWSVIPHIVGYCVKRG